MKEVFQGKKYLFKNTIIFSIGNFSTKLISFFLVPFYTYVLTAEEYGTIDLIFTVCTIISPFVMFNIHEAIKRYSLDENADHDSILTTAFIMIVFGHLVGLVIFPLLGQIKNIDQYVIQVYFYTLSMTSNLIFTEYLRGREKMVAYTVCGIISTIIIAVLNIVFLRYLKMGVKGYFLSYIIGYSISSMIAVVVGRQYLTLFRWNFDRTLFREMISFSLPLIPNALMWWVSNFSDRIMVTYMVSVAANGIYTVSYKIPTMISTVCNIFFQAWQFTAVKIRDRKDNIQFTNDVFKIYVRFIVLFSSVLLVAIKPLMRIYVSADFFQAWEYTPILIVGFAFSSVGTFVGTPYYVEKDMKGNLLSATAGAAVNIVLNFVLIPIAGIQGAAIATCLSYISVFLYRLIDTHKYIPLNINDFQYVLQPVLLFALLLLSYWERPVHYLIMMAIVCIELICSMDMIRTALVKNK